MAFDANNQYSVGGAIRVGRALEELGYVRFEEPVQHYDVRAMGEVAQRLDITVSADQHDRALVDMIEAGVRMVQPDIVKMGGITGLMQRAAICFAYGVELVPTRHSRAWGALPTCTCWRRCYTTPGPPNSRTRMTGCTSPSRTRQS